VLHRALDAARDDLAARRSIEAGRAEFAKAPAVKLDYLVLTGPDLGPAPSHGSARLLTAAWVGGTRLIDNVAVELS
jgi:pantoate--beta-alanine ligase